MRMTRSLSLSPLSRIPSLRALAQLPQPAIAAILLAFPLLAGLALWSTHRLAQDAQAREHSLERLLAEQRSRPAPPPVADTTPFPQRLPAEAYSSLRAITHLREAATAQSVSVINVGASDQAATPNTLGRMTLDFTLRGPYTGIKTTLFELLSRDASRTVLDQINWRRVPNAPEIDAQVRVTWLHRPVGVAPAPAAPKVAASGTP